MSVAFGVPADPAQAAVWNRKAAAQGHPEAQAQLARALDEGVGVQKNPDEAHKLYANAARQEQPAAQLALAAKTGQKPDCAGANSLVQRSSRAWANCGNV